MSLFGAISAVASGLSIASDIAGYVGGRKQTKAEQAYQDEVYRLNVEYAGQIKDYNERVYQQELKYRGELVRLQDIDRAKQTEFVTKSTEAIRQDYLSQYSVLMQRGVEEAISSALQTQDLTRETRRQQARAEVLAGERGISGNSVSLQVRDLDRALGEAQQVVKMNEEATNRQISLEAMGLKARADQAINNIPIRTFAPIPEVAPPAPLSPVNPAPRVSGPSALSLGANLASSALGGVERYASWSGQSVKSVLNNFKIGG